MIRAVFFDLDGTLLDTVPDIQACLNEALVHFGHEPIDYAHTCSYVGDGAKTLVKRALPAGSPDLDACYARFRTRFAVDTAPNTRLFPGARETLDELKERGLRLAVITNKPQDAADSVLKKFFPAGYFDFVGGDTGMFPCKPDPSLVRYAALTLRLAPAECMFVGDGEPDALVAQNAGMMGVSVLWGYRSREQLERVGATRFAESFSDLKKFF